MPTPCHIVHITRRISGEYLLTLIVSFCLVAPTWASRQKSATSKFNEGDDIGVIHVYPSRYGIAAQSHRGVTSAQDGVDESNCSTDTVIIDKLLNGTGYNKLRLPRTQGVDVAVEIWLQAISAIDEITNDFQASNDGTSPMTAVFEFRWTSISMR